MVGHLQLDAWLSNLTRLTLRHIKAEHLPVLATMLPRLTALQSLTLADDESRGLESGGGSALLQ
jgi:hypothetical protein